LGYQCFDVDETEGVAHIVLSSTGRNFSAGMDLLVFTSGTGGSEPHEVGRHRAALRYNVVHFQRAFSCLEEARMPVLAAVQGGVVGGAVDLVTAADCRYVPADAWFCGDGPQRGPNLGSASSFRQ